MKIAIDCRSLRKKPAGVHNLLISIINIWTAQKPDWTFYLLTNEDFSEESSAKLVLNKNVVKIIEPLQFFKKIATLWYFIKIYPLLKKIKPDVFFTPVPNLPFFVPNKVKTLVLVADMVYKLFPRTMSKGNWLINFFTHNRTIKKADMLWAISEYTKTEIERFYPSRKCKEILVGCSINEGIFMQKDLTVEEKDTFLKKCGIVQPFLLFVGTAEPRKNLKFLISLMPELSEMGFSLVVIGSKGWGKTEIEPIMLQNNFPREKVIFPGYVSIEELVNLYNLAHIYISTSKNEGFGLPQLEAMNCACPVISPHNSAMIEVVEGAGETIKDWEPDFWIETIQKISTNRNFYIQRGLEKAKQYNWKEIIERLTLYIKSH